MCPFTLLRMGFANGRLSGLEMTLVPVGPSGIELMQAQRCQQRFYLSADCVLRGPHDIREDHASSVITGRPEPSLLGFLPNEPPHLSDVGCFPLRDLNTNLAWIQVLDGQSVDGWERRRFFLTLP